MDTPMIQRFILVLISLVLASCAGTKDSVLPREGPSMRTIYHSHINKMHARHPKSLRGELGHRPIRSGVADLHGYTRDAFNEIDILFPRLPNPTLVMYVFPHLVGKVHAPVPGYATAFSMYEQVEYALPGEVPSLRFKRP